jgi:hypothetical protein
LIVSTVFIKGTIWYKTIQEATMARTWRPGKETPMAMLTFLVTIVVLSASIYAGYRFNMYLYAHRALGANSRRMAPGRRASYPARQPRNDALIEMQDYGLRYARTGILIFAVLTLLLVMTVMVVVSSVL